MAITKKDIEILSQFFVEKTEFRGAMKTIDKSFNQLAVGQDKIIGELEKMREDRLFAVAKDREQDMRLDNITRRLETVEQKV